MKGHPDVHRHGEGVSLTGFASVEASLDSGDEAPEDPLTGKLLGPRGRIKRQGGAEENVAVAGVFEAEAAVGVAADAQGLAWVGDTGHSMLQGVVELPESVRHHSLYQLVLAGEVPVDRGRGDPHLAGYAPQRQNPRIAREVSSHL